MSNCIQDKQKEKHNKIMIGNIMREREQRKNIKNNILLFIFDKNKFDKFLLVKIDK